MVPLRPKFQETYWSLLKGYLEGQGLDESVATVESALRSELQLTIKQVEKVFENLKINLILAKMFSYNNADNFRNLFVEGKSRLVFQLPWVMCLISYYPCGTPNLALVLDER